VTKIERWACVTCGTSVSTTHCPDCGESVIRARDLGLRKLIIEAFHSFTDVDSRLLRSVRALLFRPGALTTAYLEGPRKPYIAPFQLFLLANLLFFAVQSTTRDKIFSTPLDSHLHGQDWSALARDLVAKRLDDKHMSLQAYTPLFDHVVAVNARSLIFLMAVPFALLLVLMFLRNSRPFAAHIVFTLHFYAFQLMLLSMLLLALGVQARIGGSERLSAAMDTALFAIQLGASAIYLYVAAGKVYGVSGLRRVMTAAALVVTASCVVLGYRFVLFVVTLYGT
jgi:hypothetical protein